MRLGRIDPGRPSLQFVVALLIIAAAAIFTVFFLAAFEVGGPVIFAVTTFEVACMSVFPHCIAMAANREQRGLRWVAYGVGIPAAIAATSCCCGFSALVALLSRATMAYMTVAF